MKAKIFIIILFSSVLVMGQTSSHNTNDSDLKSSKDGELAVFTFTPLNGIYPNSNIQFTNLSPDTLLSYVWDFGDGTMIIQDEYIPTFSHYYETWGIFHVSLTVYGNTSYEQATDSVVISVPNVLAAGYMTDDTVCGGNVIFQASLIYTTINQWYFNETPIIDTGLFSGANTGTLTITEPNDSYIGDYYCIGSNDSSSLSTDTVTFVIGEKVEANFSATPQTATWPNSSIGIENVSSQTGNSYFWDFGDENTLLQSSYEPTFSHYYDTCGVFNLILRVENELCSDVDSQYIYILSPNLISDINNKFSLYPNPAKYFFQIEGISNNAEITIFSVDGKQISNQIISNNQKIDVRSFKKGVYIVQLKSNGRNYSLKFTKE